MGSDAVMKSSAFFMFFKIFRIEGFLMFKHPVNDVEKLVHDGSDDDDLWLALCFEACGKFFADRIVAHR